MNSYQLQRYHQRLARQRHNIKVLRFYNIPSRTVVRESPIVLYVDFKRKRQISMYTWYLEYLALGYI